MSQFHKRNSAALIGFLLAFAIGLKAVAKDENCAKTQPELRAMFPVEMRILKSFEGIWSDIRYRQGPPGSLKARNYSINANKQNIQIQTAFTSPEGEETLAEVKTAIVCKTDSGLVLKAEGIEMPILILSHKEARFKVGESWHPFFRISEVHFNFRTVKPAEGAVGGTGTVPAARQTERLRPAEDTTGTR